MSVLELYLKKFLNFDHKKLAVEEVLNYLESENYSVDYLKSKKSNLLAESSNKKAIVFEVNDILYIYEKGLIDSKDLEGYTAYTIIKIADQMMQITEKIMNDNKLVKEYSLIETNGIINVDNNKFTLKEIDEFKDELLKDHLFLKYIVKILRKKISLDINETKKIVNKL